MRRLPGAMGDDHRAQARDVLRPLPSRQRDRRIGSHDEEELRILMASRQFFERVGRVGDARSLDLAQVKLEVRLVRDGELDHANAISRGSELLVLLEVGITRGNEEHAIEPELIGHATRDDKMPVVHGIEGPAHDADTSARVQI